MKKIGVLFFFIAVASFILPVIGCSNSGGDDADLDVSNAWESSNTESGGRTSITGSENSSSAVGNGSTSSYYDSYDFVGNVPEVIAYIKSFTKNIWPYKGFNYIKIVDEETTSCEGLREALGELLLVNPNNPNTGIYVSLDFSDSIVEVNFCSSESSPLYPLWEVILPNNCTEIVSKAFYYCIELEKIVIPESVKSIGSYAFYNCSILSSVKIPSNVTIGKWAFASCSLLKSIEIPSSTISVGSYAFYYCTSLTSVTLPAGVIFEDMTFGYCTSLKTVYISEGVTSIGAYTFYHCTSLTDVYLPSSMSTIEYNTFYGCSGLTSFSVPLGVTTIQEQAFYNCIALKSIEISSSVASIGAKAFYNCSNLTNATFEDPIGWSTSKSLDESELSVTTTAAKYLRTTYVNYTWTKTTQ